MVGLVPTIHVFLQRGVQNVDARHKDEHDGADRISVKVKRCASFIVTEALPH